MPLDASNRSDKKIHVFGLTGGIASGKSTVGRHLHALGLPVIDADKLARDVVEPETPGLQALVQHFGPGVLSGDSLNRNALADLVFSDPEARRWVNNLLHPRIAQRRDEILRRLESQGEPLACYEVPLLFENSLQDKLRPVVLVSLPPALQLERACQRDQALQSKIADRIATQIPLEEKMALADYVLDNSGTLEETLARAELVLVQICRDNDIDASRYGLPRPYSPA